MDARVERGLDSLVSNLKDVRILVVMDARVEINQALKWGRFSVVRILVVMDARVEAMKKLFFFFVLALSESLL